MSEGKVGYIYILRQESVCGIKEKETEGFESTVQKRGQVLEHGSQGTGRISLIIQMERLPLCWREAPFFLL